MEKLTEQRIGNALLLASVLSLLALIVFMLAGCASGVPDYGRPDPATPTFYSGDHTGVVYQQVTPQFMVDTQTGHLLLKQGAYATDMETGRQHLMYGGSLEER